MFFDFLLKATSCLVNQITRDRRHRYRLNKLRQLMPDEAPQMKWTPPGNGRWFRYDTVFRRGNYDSFFVMFDSTTGRIKANDMEV